MAWRGERRRMARTRLSNRSTAGTLGVANMILIKLERHTDIRARRKAVSDATSIRGEHTSQWICNNDPSLFFALCGESDAPTADGFPQDADRSSVGMDQRQSTIHFVWFILSFIFSHYSEESVEFRLEPSEESNLSLPKQSSYDMV